MVPRKDYHDEKQDAATDKWLKGAGREDSGKENNTFFLVKDKRISLLLSWGATGFLAPLHYLAAAFSIPNKATCLCILGIL
jgi:hypothetical protein